MSADLKNLCGIAVECLTSLGASHAVASAHETQQRQVKFANSKIVRTSAENSADLELFAAIDGRTAVTSLTKLEETAARQTCAELITLAKKLPVNKDFVDVARGSFSYVQQGNFDKRTAELSDGCVSLAEEAIETAGKEIKAAGVMEVSSGQNYLHSSAGPKATQQTTSAYFSIRALADKNASGHKVAVNSAIGEINFNELSQEAAQLAAKSRNPTQGNAGVYNVVFDALPFAALVNYSVDSASAFNVESGLSCLAGKIGQKVANEQISIYDNPCRQGAFHSTVFDAEGFPTKQTPVIEGGILQTYLHNSSTATRFGTSTTGNAGLFSPHAWTLEVEKGKASVEEIIREARSGIYISNLWYTRFQNYSTGEFSTIPRDAAFLIENGELTKPVNRIRIASSLPHVLASTSLLSSNQRQIFGWEVETPTFSCDALVEKMHVTTPQG